MTMPDVARFAAALNEARRTGSAVELNSKLAALDGETAYAVQQEGFRLRGGGRVAGYKIGWADPAARARHGVPEPIFGRFAPGDVLADGGVHSLETALKPGIEGELVFHVDRPLPEGTAITVEHILAACSIGVGFDLMDSRLAGGASTWRAAVADNCGAGAVLLGPARTSLAEGGGRDLLARVFLTLWRDGELVDSGSAEKLGGDAAGLVAWLAGKLAAQGDALEAGQFVFTGAMAGPQWLTAAGEWEVRSVELGVARVEVTEGNRAVD
ncbi:MAG: 2-keto-4-pentenoate hydratase [Chitinophagales bacterium]